MTQTTPSPLATAALAAVIGLATAMPAAAQSRPIPCPDFADHSSWSWRLRAYAGGGQTDQTYVRPARELQAYRLLRDATEDLLVAYRGGLRAEVSHPTGLSARAGADYHVYRTRTSRGRPGGFEVDNRHQTLAPTLGVGFHRWFGPVAPYAYGDIGYELRVATTGALNAPLRPDQPLPTAVDSEPYIARAPGFQYGGTVGLDVALGEAWFAGGSVSYTQLNGLGSDEDPLDYDQTALTAAVSVGLRF